MKYSFKETSVCSVKMPNGHFCRSVSVKPGEDTCFSHSRRHRFRVSKTRNVGKEIKNINEKLTDIVSFLNKEKDVAPNDIQRIKLEMGFLKKTVASLKMRNVKAPSNIPSSFRFGESSFLAQPPTTFAFGTTFPPQTSFPQLAMPQRFNNEVGGA